MVMKLTRAQIDALKPQKAAAPAPAAPAPVAAPPAPPAPDLSALTGAMAALTTAVATLTDSQARTTELLVAPQPAKKMEAIIYRDKAGKMAKVEITIK